MVGYGRVSHRPREQRDSLEHQQPFFQDFARARGHTLVRVYADQGISGKWLKKRDGFLQMLRDAERGEFELVVVKDISRFARNTVDSLESIRRLKAWASSASLSTTPSRCWGNRNSSSPSWRPSPRRRAPTCPSG